MIDRYTSKEMKKIWCLENRYSKFLEIELSSLKALSSLGVVPFEDYSKIKENAKFDLKRIEELESLTKHDVIAFTRCVDEGLGTEKKWFHYGLTSTDVVDSATSLLIKDANNLIENSLDKFIEILKEKALKYQNTPCIGRTHGIHAEVTSFGLKWLNWYDEMLRNKKMFKEARINLEVVKISGAVGNYVLIPLEVEEKVALDKGLGYAKISTQVNSRDKISAYIMSLALIASTIEKIATEVRTLSRTEIGEVNEFFQKKQKGSSAMPHKKNPVSSENICGIARVIRSYVNPSLEDNNLWSERDISHSSVERIILPDATSLIEYILNRYGKVLDNLVVNETKMLENIYKTNGIVFSGRILTCVIDKTVVESISLSREEIYDNVQLIAFKAIDENKPFKDLVKESALSSVLSEEEIENCFSIDYYLRNVEKIYKRFNL